MSLSLAAPTPLEYFATLVRSDSDFPLLEAAISLAQDDYPLLDVQQVLSEVDELLQRVQRRLAADASVLQRLRVLNQFFYRDLNFAGNVNDYYDPDNSYLHVLLRSRRGIPISLAVLWLELAQGLGLPARGVSFPGHFMVKVTVPEGQVVLDPFSGESLSREDLSERLEPYRRRLPRLQAPDVPLGLFLQSASPREIIARMLYNLKEIHHAQSDWPRQLCVLDRLLVLVPTAWPEYRDRGLAHAELGQAAQAVQDLQTYLQRADESADFERISERVHALRRTMG